MMYKSIQILHCEWVVAFVIDYAWISKLMRDEAFTWQPKELSCWLKKWLFIWTVLVWEILLFKRFLVSREINSNFCSKTRWQMFLLVSNRYVGANLCKFEEKVSPHILRKKNCCDLNLGKSLCIFTFFVFSDSGLNGFDFCVRQRTPS